jgi:integrase
VQAYLFDAAIALRPHGSPSTRNRKVIKPATVVLHYAAEQRWCEHRRIETGLRISDLLAVEWPKIDLSAGKIAMRISKTHEYAMIQVSQIVGAMLANPPKTKATDACLRRPQKPYAEYRRLWGLE